MFRQSYRCAGGPRKEKELGTSGGQMGNCQQVVEQSEGNKHKSADGLFYFTSSNILKFPLKKYSTPD